MRTKTIIYWLFICMIALVGCDKKNEINICHDGIGICSPRTQRSPTEPNYQVSVLPKDQSTCQCPNSEQYVVNNTGRTGELSWLEYQREPQDIEPYKEPKRQTLDGGQSLKLACTVQLSKESGTCTRQVISEVEGKVYGGDKLSITKAMVVDIAKAGMEHLPAKIDPNGSCPVACKGQNTPNCVKIDARKAGSVGLGKKIAILLTKTPTIITNLEISKDLTASGNNDCLRSDIVFEGTKGYNVGMLRQDCVIQTMLPEPVKANLKITIPKTLTFDHESSVGGNFSIKFAHQMNAPNLTSDGFLTEILDGAVLQVNYDSGSYIVENEKHNCIAIRIQ